MIADKKRDFARAEHYYLTALRHDSRNPDLLGDLGYSYLLQGRREESERYLLAATRIDPTHSKALHNLSLLYAMNGDYDRSFDALRRAVGESEARVKIARLFPNGRPAATDGETMIATFEPSTPRGRAACRRRSGPCRPQRRRASASRTLAGGKRDTNALSMQRDRSPRCASAPTRPRAGRESVQACQPAAYRTARSTSVCGDRPRRRRQPLRSSRLPSPAPVEANPASHAAASQARRPCTRARAGDRLRHVGSAGRSGRRSAGIDAAVAACRLGVATTQAAGRILVRRRASPGPKAPHAVATGIVPTSANAAASPHDRQEDTLSEYEAELRKEQPVSGGRTQSNAGPAREPLVAERARSGSSGSANPHGGADAAAGPLRRRASASHPAARQSGSAV